MKKKFKIFLLPIALLYGIITLFRNRLYDWKVLKENSFNIHTICIGNLAVGGSGKTPMGEYLIRLILKVDSRIAILSRGYKRKTSGFVLATDTSSAEDIGDEPLLYKKKHNVIVAVDNNRVNGINQLLKLEKKAPKIVLLDDAFQHRSLKTGLNIVLSDFQNIYLKDYVMPYGRLREFKSEINRADIIIITKTPDKTSSLEIRAILKDIKQKPYQRVFFSYLKYGELMSISNQNEKIDTLNDLFRFRIILFTGIANAKVMVNYLKEYAAEVTHLSFNDHHDYSLQDIDFIENCYNSLEGGNKILVTTEKDLMRLKNNLIWPTAKNMNIFILPVEVTFKEKEEEFNELILNYVRRNSFHHQKY